MDPRSQHSQGLRWSSVFQGQLTDQFHSTTCFFSTVRELRTAFTFLSGWGKKKSRLIFHNIRITPCHTRKRHEIQVLVPINKVALECGQAHSFACYLGLLSGNNSEVETSGYWLGGPRKFEPLTGRPVRGNARPFLPQSLRKRCV